jgi:hypothetical protein
VRNWPLAVSAIRSLRDSGCIDRGELRSARNRIGEQTYAAKSSPQIESGFIDRAPIEEPAARLWF